MGSNCLLLFKNYVHDCGISESQQGDEELLEKYYTQFKGSKDEDKKYSLIPKFYSKVRNLNTAHSAVLVLEQNMHKVPQEYRGSSQWDIDNRAVSRSIIYGWEEVGR